MNPRPVEPNISTHLTLAALLTDAQQRLDTLPGYRTKVQSYAEQNMLPVDLEHMMVSEAAELNRRADRIANLDAQNPIITTLRDQASDLTSSGRALRTRQALASQKPTDGMLEDLLAQQVVEIRKTAAIKHLGKYRGRNDYLQEYEVWNMTPPSPQLLWYAHFHYRNPTPVFGQFEKAHLKMPQHRFLTHADDAALPYADIGQTSAVLPHFQAL